MSRISQNGHYLLSPSFQNSLSKHNTVPVGCTSRPLTFSGALLLQLLPLPSEASVSPTSWSSLPTDKHALGFFLHWTKQNTPGPTSALCFQPTSLNITENSRERSTLTPAPHLPLVPPPIPLGSPRPLLTCNILYQIASDLHDASFSGPFSVLISELSSLSSNWYRCSLLLLKTLP